MSCSIGFVVLSFLLNSFGSMGKSISRLADLSIFHAFSGRTILAERSPLLGGTLIMPVICVG